MVKNSVWRDKMIKNVFLNRFWEFFSCFRKQIFKKKVLCWKRDTKTNFISDSQKKSKSSDSNCFCLQILIFLNFWARDFWSKFCLIPSIFHQKKIITFLLSVAFASSFSSSLHFFLRFSFFIFIFFASF